VTLYQLQCLLTLRVIKSRRMRWAGHVARMGEERGAYRVYRYCTYFILGSI